METDSISTPKKYFTLIIAITMILTVFTASVTAESGGSGNNPGSGIDSESYSLSPANTENIALAPIDVSDEYFRTVIVTPSDSNEDNKNDTVRIMYDVETEGVRETVEVFLDVFNSSGALIATYSNSFVVLRTVPWYQYFDYYAKYTDNYNFSLRLYDLTHNKKENFGNNYESSKIWLSPYKPGYDISVTAVTFDRDSDSFNDDVRVTVKDVYGFYLENAAVYIDGSLKGYTSEHGTLSSANYARGYHEVDVFYNKIHANTDFKSEGNGIPSPFFVDCDPMDFNEDGSKNGVRVTVTRENSAPVRNADVYIDNIDQGKTRFDGTLYAGEFDEGFHYVNVKALQQWGQSVFYAEPIKPIEDFDEFIEFAWSETSSFDTGIIADDIKVSFFIGLDGGESSNVTMNGTLMYLNRTEIETKSIKFTVTQEEAQVHSIIFYNVTKDSFRIYLELFDEQWKLEDTWLIEEIPVTHKKMIVNVDRGVNTMDNFGSQNDVFFYTHISGDSYNDGSIMINYSSNGTGYANQKLDESGYTTILNIFPGSYTWTVIDTNKKVLEEGDFKIYPSIIISTQTTEMLNDDDFDGYFDDFRVRAYDQNGDNVNTVYVYIWDDNNQVFKEGYTSAATAGGPGSFLVTNIPEGNYTYQTRTTTIPQRIFANGTFFSYGNNTEASSYLEVFATAKDLDSDGSKNDVVVKVVDYNNNPVPNVNIYYDNDMTYYDTTDSKGEAVEYDFEYGWHHVDAISVANQPRGHAYTQFFSEGFDYDEYFWYIWANQGDADNDDEVNDLIVKMDVDVDEYEEVEVTVVAYLYYQENGTFYDKASKKYSVFDGEIETEEIYFYDLPFNTTFNATYLLFDQNNKLEDKSWQDDIMIRYLRDEVNIELFYIANYNLMVDNNITFAYPLVGFFAHQESFPSNNVTINIYKYSDNSLAYSLITDEDGYAIIDDPDFEYTRYYWKSFNDTNIVIEDEGWFIGHENLSWDCIQYDFDEDGYFDDFGYYSFWVNIIFGDDYISYDFDYVNTTMEILDGNLNQIISGNGEDEPVIFIMNLTEGDYHVRMSYLDITRDFDEFFSYGNGFDNQMPSVKITSPSDNSNYYDIDSIKFDGTGSSDPDFYDRLSYDWRSDLDGQIGTEPTFSRSLSAGIHTITLTIDDAHGHVNTTSLSLTVAPFAQPNQAPRAVISSPSENENFFRNEQIFFDGANSTDDDYINLTFTWSNETQELAANSSKFSMALDEGTHRITLRVTDPQGLNSTDIVNITVNNRAPVANISSPLEAEIYNASDDIQFDSSGSFDPDGDSIVSVLWESNRTGVIGSSPALISKLPGGHHMINLTVSDGTLNDTATVNITVINTPPVANITSPGEGGTYFKGAVFFDGSASLDLDGDVLYFYWELDSSPFMGNFSSFTKNVTDLGLHTVVLYVTDGIVNVSHMVNFTIENRAPVAYAGPDMLVNVDENGDAEIEFNASLSFDPDNDELTFIWDFDASDGIDDIDSRDEIAIFTYENLNLAPEGPILKVATLTISDSSAENDTAMDNITVTLNRWPEAETSKTSVSGTTADSINFDASESKDPDGDVLTYSWNFDDGSSGSGVNVNHTFSSAGNYNVTLNVSDGNAWDTAVVKVTIIEPNRPPVAVAGNDIIVNPNTPVSFDGSLSSDPDGDTLTFIWDFGDGILGTGVRVNHTYTKIGVFIVTLTVDDGKGGTSSSNLTVTINKPPSISVEEVNEGVIGQLIKFDASDSTDPENQLLSFEWDFGDGTDTVSGSVVNRFYSSTGTFTVKVKVSDPHGANDTYSFMIRIDPIEPPIIDDPGHLDVVSGMLTIGGRANTETVGEVEVYYENDTAENRIGTATLGSSGTWSLTWNTQAVSNGVYEIKARAVDKEGDFRSEFSTTVKITVENEVSDTDESPITPELPVDEKSIIDKLLGLEMIVYAGCGIIILIIIVLIAVAVTRSGRQRGKRAPAEAIAAAQRDMFQPISESEDLGFEEISEEEEKPEKDIDAIKRPVRCPSCKEIFISKDTGDRPWMLFCTQCGSKGMIKDDKPRLPPAEEKKKEREERIREKVKCPECTEIFSVWSDERSIECPNCGVTGEK